MATANVQIKFTLSAEDFEDILDTAGYAVGHWANNASIEFVDENSEEIIYRVSDNDSGKKFTLNRSDIENAICKLIEKRNCLADLLIQAVTQDDYSEVDTMVADKIIQFACFKEVIYA